MAVPIKIQRSSSVEFPSKQTIGSSGYDLFAHTTTPVDIQPGCTALISTGIRVQIPLGYEAQIRPRSGLALKHGITVANSPGTIDSDYRGEIGIILINHGKAPFRVNPKDRLAQMVICQVPRTFFQEVNYLDESQRGEGGFGHTGVADCQLHKTDDM